MKEERVKYLLEQYVNKASSWDEMNELMALVNDSQYKEHIEAFMDARFETEEISKELVDVDWNEMYHTVISTRRKSPVRRMSTWRWVAAACVMLLLGLGSYLMFFNKSKVEAPPATVAKTNDVPAPKETRAVITLADGRQVYLDSANSGTLAVQDNIKVVRTADGKIAYQDTANSYQLSAKSLASNTLTNPRGSRVIDMQLSDGSHVWLNAGSSLKYPVAFVGKERKVEISGEAYFEVAHDASKPFKVSLPGEVGEVEVLGTHFNINAYDDEEALKVTLLEGSVKLSASSTKQIKSSAILKSGEQGQLQTTNYKLQTIPAVDLDEVMAWKNGKFSFNKVDIKTVMRQLARWYDLEVVYEGEVPADKFWGDMQRDLPLSKTLDFLAKSNVHFKVEGKKVTVMK